jgi:hypothetical protein
MIREKYVESNKEKYVEINKINMKKGSNRDKREQ